GFATRVAEAGFTVWMPSLFGAPGAPYSAGNIGRQIAGACVSREFSILARHEASPVTTALRSLARQLHGEVGGPGVGAIGMCLTGNFALTMLLEPAVLAPVLSQPSLPFALSPSHAAALHASPEAVDCAKRRARGEGLRVLGLRFTHALMCPRARFDTLRRELGDAFEAIEIDSSPGNAHGIPITSHAVLTKDLVDHHGHPTMVALARVLAFLDEQLRPASN
ncbi:MAG: dienelactone hydrolase, partial [Myxococcales bacterium]|nr:dienelactone hydrolase [Myxococcales bacterium]